MAQTPVAVVTEFQTKTTSGQIINPIGADIKYIKSNKFSNNNLEEEWLLGSSRIITTYNDFEKQAIVNRIEYRPSLSQIGDYYVLETYEYGKGLDNSIDITNNADVLQFVITNNNGYAFPSKSDPKVDGAGLHLNTNFYVGNNNTELHQTNYDVYVIYDVDNNKLLFIPTFITENDKLYYIDSSGNERLVATKEISGYYDPNNINIYKITEIVTKNN